MNQSLYVLRTQVHLNFSRQLQLFAHHIVDHSCFRFIKHEVPIHDVDKNFKCLNFNDHFFFSSVWNSILRCSRVNLGSVNANENRGIGFWEKPQVVL